MLVAKCATWGTGPIGTAHDGCHDTGEYVYYGASVAVVGLAVWAAASERRLGVCVGLALSLSSLYHIVYGEGTMSDAITVADDGAVAHGVVLAVVNTREITVTGFAAVVAWLYRGWPTAVYALLAVATGVSATWSDDPYIIGVTAFADAVGVAAGAWVATEKKT